MTTFSIAIDQQMTHTANGMPAHRQTGNACTDLFFKAGAMRGQAIVPTFVSAFVENQDYATRIAAWLRDVRGGAGERALFRDILIYLGNNYPEVAKKFIPKIPTIGRWDDMLVFSPGSECEMVAFTTISDALRAGDALCAKWMPREKSSKRDVATRLRKFMKLSSKEYRKMLSNLTSVVENNMCAKTWSNINYSHVPSVAASRYKAAFIRNDGERYNEYVKALVSGDKSVKINAEAIFPHEVLKGLFRDWYGVNSNLSKTELDVIRAQWNSLPDYVDDSNILPMVDVSGSMYAPLGGNASTTCMEVAVSLGLYLADKNKGKFKDSFLTFSRNPELATVRGDIIQKIHQMVDSSWGMNTNLEAAMQLVLKVAQDSAVPQSEMPEMLLILSDMNFDYGVRNANATAMQLIEENYKNAGYEVPKIVFWNLNAQDHVPVRFDKNGTALISGYSPSILKSILRGGVSDMTPESVMLETIMDPRYNILGT